MKLRSLLFVPGDSERKFAKASASGADALILDLEDAVAPAAKDAARDHVAALTTTRAPRDWSLWVRVNAWDSTLTLRDLAAVVGPGLDGVLLPKADGIADVVRLGHCLDALEARADLTPGSVRIAVVATETAAAVLNLAGYAAGHARLAALTWGAEDLSAAVGAAGNRKDNGNWSFPYRAARAQALFAAYAAGAAAIDTLDADYRDLDALARDSAQSRRDGFTGRLAIHPDQVAVINAAFAPSANEVAHARAIVAAFAAQPGAGTLGVDGKMVDVPHLKAAQALLARV